MKVFFVFLGLLIINTSFLAYQGDMGRYVRCQIFLKALAEECAAGAALYYDEESYSDGELRFLYGESRKYIEFILEESRKKMPLPKDTTILHYEVSFEDDFLGCEGNPSVTVELSAETEDLFRLPFLEVSGLKRAAKYEMPQ